LKKVNLAKVRSMLTALILAAPAFGPVAGAHAAAGPPPAEPRITIAILPQQVGVETLAEVDGLAVGLLQTGIGAVSPEQAYLDIGQGNRTSVSLYDDDRPPPLNHLVDRAAAGSHPSRLRPVGRGSDCGLGITHQNPRYPCSTIQSG